MRGRKLPINPHKSRKIPINPADSDQSLRRHDLGSGKNGQCPNNSDYFCRIPHNAHRCSLSSRGLKAAVRSRRSPKTARPWVVFQPCSACCRSVASRTAAQQRKQEGLPSTTPDAASMTDRNAEWDTAQVASNYIKADATPLHLAQPAAKSAGTKDAQTAPQFHHQTTPRTPRSEQSLPTKRTAPRHANRRRANTKRRQTHPRSAQAEDANAQHTPTAKATANRANERRDTDQTRAHGKHTGTT